MCMWNVGYDGAHNKNLDTLVQEYIAFLIGIQHFLGGFGFRHETVLIGIMMTRLLS